MVRTFFLLLVFVLSISFIAGCGPKEKRSGVSGSVTMDGKPVDGAQITFTPKAGNPSNEAYGQTDASGKYTLRGLIGGEKAGVLAGEYKVTIIKRISVDSGKKTPDLYPDEKGNTKMVSVMVEKDMLPIIYGDLEKTPLSASVADANAVIDFKLDSKLK